MNKEIEFNDFMKVSMHTGTIVSATLNKKARNPAYVMQIDFGDELGMKTTSAQITNNYDLDSLPGKQVIAVTNCPALRVAGVISEVLVLGVATADGVVLLGPDRSVGNGLRIS